MTNNEAIGFLQIASNTVTANFQNDSKVDLSNPLYYGLKKSIRAIKPTTEELEEINKDISEAFKKSAKVDEKQLEDAEYLKKVNDQYKAYLEIPENVKVKTDFLNAEFKGEFHKVSIDDIDSSKLPIYESEVFERYLVDKK